MICAPDRQTDRKGEPSKKDLIITTEREIIQSTSKGGLWNIDTKERNGRAHMTQ